MCAHTYMMWNQMTPGKNNFCSPLPAESCHARRILNSHSGTILGLSLISFCRTVDRIVTDLAMPSSQEDGTAAAAEQLSSMSLGESVERKDNESESNEDTERSGIPTKLCSARGLLHHASLSETLQAYYLARTELKSEDRDKYIDEYMYLKIWKDNTKRNTCTSTIVRSISIYFL